MKRNFILFVVALLILLGPSFSNRVEAQATQPILTGTGNTRWSVSHYADTSDGKRILTKENLTIPVEYFWDLSDTGHFSMSGSGTSGSGLTFDVTATILNSNILFSLTHDPGKKKESGNFSGWGDYTGVCGGLSTKGKAAIFGSISAPKDKSGAVTAFALSFLLFGGDDEEDLFFEAPSGKITLTPEFPMPQ